MGPKYLFILCPPYSGSTVLYNLIQTSPNVSPLPDEAQHLPELQIYYGPRRWYKDPPIDWVDVKSVLHTYWDSSKPVLLEKSPPNLLHAFDIQEYFQPAYFIVLMRNVYANCEGFRRRMGITLKRSAEFWQRIAKLQINNIGGLEHVIHVKYEDMVNNPQKVKNDILKLLPEMENIDINIKLSVHSIDGIKEKKLYNFNHKNIVHLSNKDIQEINSVLLTEPDLLNYFGYEFIYPTLEHNIKYWINRLNKGVSRRAKRLFDSKLASKLTRFGINSRDLP